LPTENGNYSLALITRHRTYQLDGHILVQRFVVGKWTTTDPNADLPNWLQIAMDFDDYPEQYRACHLCDLRRF
jgi:hypothetical protein